MPQKIESGHEPGPRARQAQQHASAPTIAKLPGGDLSELLQHLQRTAGNQAVNALLQRWTAGAAPREQQRGLGGIEPLPLNPTGASHERKAEVVEDAVSDGSVTDAAVTDAAVTNALVPRKPVPLVAGTAQVSRAIQRDVDVPTGLSGPGVPRIVSLLPKVRVDEDGISTLRTTYRDPKDGPDFRFTTTLGAATRRVDVQTTMAGGTTPFYGYCVSSATTSFAVGADGSIRDISHRDMPLEAHLTGISATAIPLQLSPTPHHIGVMMGVGLDASTTVADTHGTTHATATSSGTTTATTIGTAHTEGRTSTKEVGGQIGAGKGPISGNLGGKVQWSDKDEDTSSYSNAIGTSIGSQTTDGTNAGQTTTHPGTQNRLAGTVTVEIDSPPRAAQSASIEIANFGIDRAHVEPTMPGQVHKFLVSENPLHEDLLALLQKRQAKITIAGYASVTGPKDPNINEDYNTKLAKRRAMAMKDALVRGYGIRDDAFYPVIAYGATKSDPHTDDPKKREDPAWRKVTIEVTIAQQDD